MKRDSWAKTPPPGRVIYLVRHARCGKPGSLLGVANPSLTADGRTESAELARRLREEGIGLIVSSSLRRARETAEILAAEMNLTVHVDERLVEISYGPWDGLTWAEIEARYPVEAAKKLADWFNFTPAGAEPFAAFLDRAKLAWQSIAAQPVERTIVVAHRTVNAVLLALSRKPGLAIDHLRGVVGNQIYTFEQPHASVVIAGVAQASDRHAG